MYIISPMGEEKDKIIAEAIKKVKEVAGDLSQKLNQQIKIEINTNPNVGSVKVNFTQVNL